MKAIRKVLFFIIFEVLFCSLFGIYLVFYGPFTRIKETIVTSAMTTLNHKYLATLFLSDAEIKKIMNENSINTGKNNVNQDLININYSDEDCEVINISTNKFKGYLLIVDNPARVKIGTTDDLGKKGTTLSSIVKKYGASGGINAGGFSNAMTGTGGIPSGIIIENYKIMYSDNHKKYNIVGFNNKNILIVGEYTIDEIKELKIRDAISFWPPLIINGETLIKNGDGGWGIAPRTAIGQTEDGKVLLLTIDGRQKNSMGATLKDVQNIMYEYGAYNASTLDGGSSATMYYNGKLINNPSDILGERAIPSAFIIK
jgi:exopolysaccharide biosynthesis protein